jgi:hypothetical protein
LFRVDFWDVPFPEVKGPNVARIMQGADGFAFVFNAGSIASVDAVDEWRMALRKHRKRDGLARPHLQRSVPIALIVHKSDLKKTLLGSGDLDDYCRKCGYLFWKRTSVFEPASVMEAVESLTTAVLVQHLEE